MRYTGHVRNKFLLKMYKIEDGTNKYKKIVINIYFKQFYYNRVNFKPLLAFKFSQYTRRILIKKYLIVNNYLNL